MHINQPASRPVEALVTSLPEFFFIHLKSRRDLNTDPSRAADLALRARAAALRAALAAEVAALASRFAIK